MGGMFVSWPEGITLPPSQHYGLCLQGASDLLRRATARLIDGQRAFFDASNIDVTTIEVDPAYLKFATMDVRRWTGDKCFVLNIWRRTRNDGRGSWDSRDIPTLPTDVQAGRTWEFYNCLVTLREHSKAKALAGEYPDD